MCFSFSEFLLNHLHSNHKHRRYNGDSLDLTMIVPQIDVDMRRSTSLGQLNGSAAGSLANPNPGTTQTWPFVEIYSHKRYFYLEAQSFCLDGHAELFLWLWFLGGYVCMYRGRPSWRCPWDRAFQLGQGEGPIGLVHPISQPRGTNGTASLTLNHTYALICAF